MAIAARFGYLLVTMTSSARPLLFNHPAVLAAMCSLALACSADDKSGGAGGNPSSEGGAVPMNGGAAGGGGAATGPTAGEAPRTDASAVGGAAGSSGSAGTPVGTPDSGSEAGATRETGTAPGVAPLASEDFESAAIGTQPPGWDNFIGYVKNSANPQGDASVLVDSARAHSGKNSVHFHGGTTPVMLTRALPTGTSVLYVRGYFYMTRQLGMHAEPLPNHETLIGIRKTPGQAGDEVRFGEIKGVIGTNEVPSDNISPKMAQWGSGPIVAANSWACIEVAFLADQPQHVLRAWADGVVVHEITAGDQWQNGTMAPDWMKGKFVEVMVGWHSFSGATNDIWMDDLVLSTAPIGCN